MRRLADSVRLVCIGLVFVAVAFVASGSESPPDPSPGDSPASGPSWVVDMPKDDSDAAKLLHFDSPQRIHGRFLVQFKSDSELSAAANQLTRFSNKQMPTNADNAKIAAAEVAKQVGGRVVDILGRVGGKDTGFTFVIEMPDEKALDLAKDPRIKMIEPDMKVNLTSDNVQTLPSNDSLWNLDRIDQATLPVDHLYHYDNEFAYSERV